VEEEAGVVMELLRRSRRRRRQPPSLRAPSTAILSSRTGKREASEFQPGERKGLS